MLKCVFRVQVTQTNLRLKKAIRESYRFRIAFCILFVVIIKRRSYRLNNLPRLRRELLLQWLAYRPAKAI